MRDDRLEYYNKMLGKGRLIPIIIEERFLGFITFYLTRDEHRFDNIDPWEVLEDNPDGDILYIAQLLTSKSPENPNIFMGNWNRFKRYLKSKFPNIRYVFWRRWDDKKKIVKVHKKEL